MEKEEQQHEASHSLNEAADHNTMNTTIRTRRRNRGRMAYVEPMIFLSVMSSTFYEIVATNIIEVQYCRSVLHIHEVNSCLNHTAPHFSSVQKYASNFFMIQLLMYTVFTSQASIFLGPWSDTFGRRPIILCGTIGTTLTLSMWFFATYSNIHPNYFLLLDLPLDLSGSMRVTRMAAKCYVCDITTTETRIFRIGVLTGLEFSGALTGSLLIPYLQNVGYSFPLIVAVLMKAVVLLYTLFFLEETVSIPKDRRKLVSKNPFQFSHVKSIYKTCLIEQPPIVVHILIYTILLDAVSVMQLLGEKTVFYLFLQKALGWTVGDYSQLRVFITISQALAAFTSTSKLLNLSDLTIVNLLTGIRFLSALVFFFGTQNWLVYITAPLSGTGRLTLAVVRSFLSKIVQPNEIGKFFALCEICAGISPFLGSPIYTTVYKATMDTHPKAIFLVSAALALIMENTLPLSKASLIDECAMIVVHLLLIFMKFNLSFYNSNW